MSKLPNENNEVSEQTTGHPSDQTSSPAADGIQRASVDPAVIKVELLISKLLRIGVMVSLVIMTTGVVLGVVQNRPEAASPVVVGEIGDAENLGDLGRIDTQADGQDVGQVDPPRVARTEPVEEADSLDTEKVRASKPPFVPTLRSLPKGMVTFDGIAWMTVGLLVLIATPVMRVAISALLFARMGDRIFVGITLFVLTMLIVSFFLGHGK